MKSLILILALISVTAVTHALVINEVMSNPVGDDGGREWIELYNNEDTEIAVTSLSVSIKGGAFIGVTLISGANAIPSHGYAIVASTVTGVTKFTQDYSSYTGPLFKSSISLVNTGVTSLEVKLNGVSADILPSYVAAKEGGSYSRIGGVFVLGVPTPGEENKIPATSEENGGTEGVTLSKMSSPSADIVLSLPEERTIVAGAPSLFSVKAMTQAGKSIDNISYTWSFGDGGQSTGSTTIYRYLYPGRYIATVEGTNGLILGTKRIIVRAVAPELSSTIGSGKYGTYVDITNPNIYDLDLSDWKLSIDGAVFHFPKNTFLQSGVTRFSGVAMGFASTTIASSTVTKLLFQNMEEVIQVNQEAAIKEDRVVPALNTVSTILKRSAVQSLEKKKGPINVVKSTTKNDSFLKIATTTLPVISAPELKRDTRIASFIKSLFQGRSTH